MIYFIQPVVGGPVKIGYTGDVPRRVKQLESRYKQPLALLAVVNGDRDVEVEIHERFAHLRFGLTEQFRPAADLMAFIGKPLLVGANPDAVEAMEPVEERRPSLIAIKCRSDFKEWLAEFAKRERLTSAQVVEFGLLGFAKERNFREPPER